MPEPIFTVSLQFLTGDTDRPSYQHELQPVLRTHQAPTHLNFITSPVLDEPEPEPFDPQSLKTGWRLQYKQAGVQGMLTLVQRCVPPSVDAGRLWLDVRETFPGLEESVLIDRLLDTVVSRVKHAERVAEAAT